MNQVEEHWPDAKEFEEQSKFGQYCMTTWGRRHYIRIIINLLIDFAPPLKVRAGKIEVWWLIPNLLPLSKSPRDKTVQDKTPHAKTSRSQKAIIKNEINKINFPVAESVLCPPAYSRTHYQLGHRLAELN